MFVRVVNCTRTPAALRPVEPSAGAGSRSRTTTDSPRGGEVPGGGGADDPGADDDDIGRGAGVGGWSAHGFG